MWKRLLPKMDWYVTRGMLSMFGLSAVGLCMLVAVVHAFQRMDEFRGFVEERGYSALAAVWLVTKYYLCLTPQYFIQFMVPFIAMLAGIIVVSSLSRHREFTAMRASGVPLRRILTPVLATALGIGVAVFLARDAVLPPLARQAHRIALLMESEGEGEPTTIVLPVGDQVRSYMMGHFDPSTRTAYNFRLEVRDREALAAGRASRYELYLDTDPVLGDGVWYASHPRNYRRGPGGLVKLDPADIPTRLTPAMLEQEVLGPVIMTAEDLRALSGDVAMQTELAQRRAAPLAGAVILLVGIGLVIRRERVDPGSAVGRVTSVVFALVVCGGYYVVQYAFLELALTEAVGPNLAAWTPNVLFGAWGGYSFWRLDH